MASDENMELALQLLQEDLAELESRQKGKQTAGQHTDLDLSIKAMRDDILALQTCIQDRTLAVSTGTAIVTDQNILQRIRHEEAVAEQDREHARAIENDQTHHLPDPSDPLLTPGFDFDDSISTVMGDLMDQMTLTDRPEPDNGEGSSHRVLASRARITCVSCMEQFDKADSFASPCGHDFCIDCIRWLFLGSIRDEELYPPRCCGRVIPPGTAIRILDFRELQEFSARAMEYRAKDRVYCAEPTCSKFIPEFAIKNDHGTCPACRRRTHIPCRSLAHPFTDCPADQPLQDVLALAEAESWRRCFNCRTMVELNHGCHHITCKCGHHFCYVCGRKWKTCDCDLWQENRLLAVAQEAVADEVAPNARIEVRANALNRIVEELRNHEDVGCDHQRRSQWRYRNSGSLQCDVCNYVLPEYIFVCSNCRMKACYRCRRHRLR